MNLADGLPLLKKAKQVNGQYLYVGKVWFGIVALPLDRSRKAASVVAANEQVDSDKRIPGIHVAKGGLPEKMLEASLFKPPAATWFFNP